MGAITLRGVILDSRVDLGGKKRLKKPSVKTIVELDKFQPYPNKINRAKIGRARHDTSAR